MPRNDLNNSDEPASLKLKQSRCASSIQPWLDFSRRSALVRRATVDDIHYSIVHYKPAGTQRNTQSREFIRKFIDRAPSGQIIRSAGRDIPIFRYPCDTNIL